MSFRPFSQNSSFEVFRDHLTKVIDEIMSLQSDYLLNRSMTELEKYYIDRALIDPIVLDFDKKYIENETGFKVKVDDDPVSWHRGYSDTAYVQGTKLHIAIPYKGDSNLWQVQPLTGYLSGYPEIEDKSDRIIVEFVFKDSTVDENSLTSEINRKLHFLNTMVTNLKNEVEKHNAQVEKRVREALEKRKQICLRTSNAIESIGIPIKRLDQPLTYNIPVERKKVKIVKPKPNQESYEPEPALAEEEYQNILNVIRSMSLVIERNPKSFSSIDEESIRTNFLLQLNGHYEGSATGETFNASGKTDILIRVDNKNVFIAECKFWRGSKSFDDAVTQLLDYLSWRDSKCALLIFNKNRDSSAVLEKMNEVMSNRKEYRKKCATNDDTGNRYVFIKDSDPGKEIIITTMLFDIPITDHP